jgi:SOS-response transcriptional repressor LexA
MGTSPQQIERLEKNQRRLNQDWIDKASAAFGVPPAAIISEEAAALTDANATPFKMEGASLDRPRNDLPIYGTALGAARPIDGDAIEQTTLNRAEVVQYAKRPTLLNGNARAYGLYVSGSSMFPRYDDGDIVVVDPKDRLRIGDDVVVYLRPDNPEEDTGETARAALLKRLRRRTASYIELEQFTPPSVFQVPMEEVVDVHRVIPPSEMLS